MVVSVGVDEVVADEDSCGVGVDDEDGTVEGVEEDGVGGFGAYAFYGEELRAKQVGGDIVEHCEVGVASSG